MIRGRAVRKSPDSVQEELEPGAVLQSSQEDQVIATEAVTFVAWDKQKLYQFIHDAQDLQLVKLVDEMMRDASMGADHRSVDASTKAAEASGQLCFLGARQTQRSRELGPSLGRNPAHPREGCIHVGEDGQVPLAGLRQCQQLLGERLGCSRPFWGSLGADRVVADTGAFPG